MKRGIWRFWLAAFATAMLTGCAYRLGPSNGVAAGDRSVQVEPFYNKTLEPHLTDYVENSLRRQLQEDGTYRVNTHNDGDIILSGVILSYGRTPLNYQPTDVITAVNYELSISAQVTAKEKSTGRVIFTKAVSGRALVAVGADQTSSERASIPMLADDLAKRAVAALVDGNW